MKSLKKVLSIVLTIAIMLPVLVMIVPTSFAAAFPSSLKNGNEDVIYTQALANEGQYLVEIDVVKYNPNTSLSPEPILSQAGDITLVYKPNNGTAPEVTEEFEGVIPANFFSTQGDGTFSYYAVVEGFPQKANISVKKTNLDENDSGLYVAIKLWNVERGLFEDIFDFTKIERSNGIGTNSLMFSDIAVLNRHYPYAKSGSVSMNNFTLPSGLSPVSKPQTFSVVDQWGVTMVMPNISYTPVIGLTFSQDKNVMTVKGTGDANNPNGSTRTVTLTATYDTLNSTVSNNFSISGSLTITNSSTLTYAPTYANRDKAGLSISFKAGSTSNPKQFALDSSYKMKTINYVVLKNNATRTAQIKLYPSERIQLQTTTYTLGAGQSTSIRIYDNGASGNFTADVTAEYTLDGLYDASSVKPITLTAGSTVACVYNKVTTPDVRLWDDNWGWGWLSGATVDVYCKYQASHGVLDLVSTSGQNNNNNVQSLKANFYIDTDDYPNYQDAGLGFYFKPNVSGDYTFQPNENDAGYYVQKGTYASAGTFGFSTSAASSAHTSRYCEKVATGISSSGTFVPFYGKIFTAADSTSPAEIYFDGDQGNDDGLEIVNTDGTDNACYLNSNLYVYAYSKSALKSAIESRANMLSCYYDTTAYDNYCSMSNSSLKSAQTVLGTDMTNQKAVNDAKDALGSSYTTAKNSSANGTYALIHNKHTGDKSTAIEATTVDFYVFEKNSSNKLLFNSFSDECNKHSNSYTATLNTSGTYQHTYDYWNIDFTRLNETLANYNTVAPEGQFMNVDEAVGPELDAARKVDTSSETELPATQNEVDTIVNELNEAMRDLVYTSYTMTITHQMVTPDGSREIENEEIYTRTTTDNKTATYGDVLDGIADLSDTTYTIKDMPYKPKRDPLFEAHSFDSLPTGIPLEYTCIKDETIHITYYANPIEDDTLDNIVTETMTKIFEWEDIYTASSLDAYVEWFDEKYNDGTLTQSFSEFDVEAYQALLAEVLAEQSKLDFIAEDAQINQLSNFVFEYEMLEDLKDSYCHGNELCTEYAADYARANELIELSAQRNAGKNEVQAVLDEVSEFKLTSHSEGEHEIVDEPYDGINGRYIIRCARCTKIVDRNDYACPNFNQYHHPAYDYANRGAALRVDDKTAEDKQDLRFTASCLLPVGAQVVDFGFVWTQTKYLNSGVEPALDDNTPVNVDGLYDGASKYVFTESMINGKYTTYESDTGTTYTFNLVITGIKQEFWSTHYAARSYIKYVLNGIEVTVYDKSYSSRAPLYIAQRVVANHAESPATRNYIAQKFGI